MEDEAVALESAGAFVPFPAALLDEWLPGLRDTEWRLLCVVVRQTLGWKDADGKGRKKRDWMTQAQLMRRTGRNSAAVSRALDTLVRKQLLRCTGEDGDSLATPAERRRHRGRVYIALAPRLFNRPAKQKDKPAVSKAPNPMSVFTGWEKADAIFEKSLGTGSTNAH